MSPGVDQLQSVHRIDSYCQECSGKESLNIIDTILYYHAVNVDKRSSLHSQPCEQ